MLADFGERAARPGLGPWPWRNGVFSLSELMVDNDSDWRLYGVLMIDGTEYGMVGTVGN